MKCHIYAHQKLWCHHWKLFKALDNKMACKKWDMLEYKMCPVVLQRSFLDCAFGHLCQHQNTKAIFVWQSWHVWWPARGRKKVCVCQIIKMVKSQPLHQTKACTWLLLVSIKQDEGLLNSHAIKLVFSANSLVHNNVLCLLYCLEACFRLLGG